MHRRSQYRIGIRARLRGAWDILSGAEDFYGAHWGDPEKVPPLKWVRDHYVLPYAKSGSVIAEIGPGGGRWTRYMLDAEKIYAIDPFPELLSELKRSLASPAIETVCNNGADFPGIADHSVDFLFTFGVFVHLEQETIRQYLQNMPRILKPNAVAVIQYSDDRKPMAQANGGFTKNNPEEMREMVSTAGFTIDKEDTHTLWHSAIIQFKP